MLYYQPLLKVFCGKSFQGRWLVSHDVCVVSSLSIGSGNAVLFSTSTSENLMASDYTLIALSPHSSCLYGDLTEN